MTDLPSIYVGSTITKNKKVNCVINSNNNIELLCTPNEKNMPMKGTYEIYYSKLKDGKLGITIRTIRVA